MLVRAREQGGPFRHVADLARRVGLDKSKLQGLAEADAMAVLGVGRREAAWALQGLWNDLPLFAGLGRDEPAPELPVETPSERIQADFRRVGLSIDTHPMQLVRPHWPGLAPLEELFERPNGAAVRIAGLVSNRQRPGTANGVVFMTLEDETALVNLVVWPKVWARDRRLARRAVLVGAEGVLQSQDGAISVVVDRFWSVDEVSPAIGGQSRDFR
jgi:error-prone DNA polymerase